jgi:serine/threonine-protein kinase
MMYEMLAGVLPFSGTPIAIARQNLSSPPPRISARVPGLSVDPDLEAIALRLMEKRPKDRFQSAEEVIAALDALAPPRPARLATRPRVAPLHADSDDSDDDKWEDDESDIDEFEEDDESEDSEPRTRTPPPEVVRVTARSRRASAGAGAALYAVTDNIRAMSSRRKIAAVAIIGTITLLTFIAASFSGDASSRSSPAALTTEGREAAPSPRVDIPVAGAAIETDSKPAAPQTLAPQQTATTQQTPAVQTPPSQQTSTQPTPVTQQTSAAIGEVTKPGPGVRTVIAAKPGRGNKPGRSRKVTASGTAQPADTAPARPHAEKPSAAPPGEKKITQSSLTALYVQVGEAIEKAARSHGESSVVALRRRYREIPFQDAVRKESMRAEVERDLKQLRGRVAKLAN